MDDDILLSTMGQDEIDALLNQVQQGAVEIPEIEETITEEPESSAPPEEEEKIIRLNKKKTDKKIKLRPYDPKRPDKFAKEHLRTLRKLFESFARSVATTFSTMLRSMVKVNIVAVEQVTFTEFSNTIPQPTVIIVYNVGGMLSGKAILQLSLEVFFPIMDRLLGGPGLRITETDKRPLTSLEEPIAKRIGKIFLEHLKEAWSSVVKIAPQIELLEYNPQFAQIVPGSDIVLIATFNVKMENNVEGVFSICTPYIVLEPIMDKLSSQFFYSISVKTPSLQDIQSLELTTLETTAHLSAILGKSHPTVREVLLMKPGDVIVLDQKINKDISVEVNSVEKFKAKVGKVGNKIAISITEVLDNNILGGSKNEI